VANTRILAIVGSPRKGDGFQALQKVEAKMKELGRVDFEYLFLKDQQLKPCLGCHLCVIKGEAFCPLNDDLQRIIEKIETSDGVILSTPVYTNHVSGLMKSFLDRLAYLWHRPKWFHHKIMGLASGGGMFGPVQKYLRFTSRAMGMDFVGCIGVPHLDAMNPKPLYKVLRTLDQKAERFFYAVSEKQKLSPSLFQLIWFQMWKMNAIATKFSMADYAYWEQEGWLERPYFYDCSVSPIKKGLVRIVAWMMRLQMKRVYKGYE
jgi:multimeric flavodoxin WrbA